MRQMSLSSVAIATLCSLFATSPYQTVAFTLVPQTLSSSHGVPFFTKSNDIYSTISENENAPTQTNSMDIIPTENTEISVDNKTYQKKSLSFDPSKCTITIIPSKYGNAFSVQKTSLKSWETVKTIEPFHPNSGVHRWAVRVDRSVQGHIMLGVMTSMASLNTFIGGNPFSWGAAGNQALWHRNKKIRNDYGEAFGTGSIIVLTLDTYTGTLSYGTLSNSEQLTNEEIVSALIDDVEDWGIAFEGLPLDTELFPAVSLFQRNDMVTLIGMDSISISIQEKRGEHLFGTPSITTSKKGTSSKNTLNIAIKTEAEKTLINEEMEAARLAEIAEAAMRAKAEEEEKARLEQEAAMRAKEEEKKARLEQEAAMRAKEEEKARLEQEAAMRAKAEEEKARLEQEAAMRAKEEEKVRFEQEAAMRSVTLERRYFSVHDFQTLEEYAYNIILDLGLIETSKDPDSDDYDHSDDNEIAKC